MKETVKLNGTPARIVILPAHAHAFCSLYLLKLHCHKFKIFVNKGNKKKYFVLQSVIEMPEVNLQML